MMCESARDLLFKELAKPATPERLDAVLDLYLDFRDRATEWDAGCWGFHPDDWMADERQKMERRIRAERKIAAKR